MMVLARQASGVIDERPADQTMEMSFFCDLTISFIDQSGLQFEANM